MGWCFQAPSHYLRKCCPRSNSPYGITGPQWIKNNLLTNWLSGHSSYMQLPWVECHKTTFMIVHPGGGVGWGVGVYVYSVQKLMGVCRWPLKIGPKKIEGKWNLGPKRSNSVRIGSFNTPKRSFCCWWMRKSTPKKIEFNPQNVKKIRDGYLEHFLWNCPQLNATRLQW